MADDSDGRRDRDSFGQIVLYSAAGGSLTPWALSQGVRFYMFVAAAILLSYVPEQVWRRGALPVYAIIVVLLVLVELIGAVKGGSQRWLDLGIRLQPSEFMKPAIVLACARFYDMLPAGETRRFGAIWPAALLVGIPAGLIMLQPDLGTALMVCAGGVTVMFLAGVPLRLFVGGALSLAIAAPACGQFPSPRLSEEPRPHLPRSRKRPAGHRLSHQPVEDRDRLGRHFRQGLPSGHAESPRLSA